MKNPFVTFLAVVGKVTIISIACFCLPALILCAITWSWIYHDILENGAYWLVTLITFIMVLVGYFVYEGEQSN